MILNKLPYFCDAMVKYFLYFCCYLLLRLYPPGGFRNWLQSARFPPLTQPYPLVNSPAGSQLPENFHFVGGQMSHVSVSPTTTCSIGTPSPTGSSALDPAQENEVIDVDDNNIVEPVRADVRSNRRLNWSHDEDIKLVS